MIFGFLSHLNEDDKKTFKEHLEGNYTLRGTCWEWRGPRNHTGYGTFKKHLVHRLAYALFIGDFRRQQFICHHCDNPSCYNPQHLYLGDAKTNGKDAAKRSRTKHRSIYKSVENQKEQSHDQDSKA